MKNKKALKITIGVLVAIGILGSIFSGDNSKKEAKDVEVVEVAEEVEEVQAEESEEKIEETDVYGWTSNDKIKFRTVTETIADKFLTKYKTPWGNDDWTFVKFDDNGKVLVTTDITIKDTSVKQPILCIFTWNPENESYIGHFFAMGNVVYYDDGSCDEFFNQLIEMNLSN